MAVFTGTSGDDVLRGTSADDVFHLEDGGADRAAGGLGSDEFFVGAALGAGDQIKGGKGFDTVQLDGDYSAGLVISSSMLVSIETLQLARGFDYDLTLSSAILDPHDAVLFIRGDALRAGDDMRIDASAIDRGMLAIVAGGGDDLLIGSSTGTEFALRKGGDDTAIGGAGEDFFNLDRAFTADDRIDGGAGRDQVSLSGGGDQPIVLGGEAIRDVEAVALFSNSHFDLTVTDTLLDAGETLLLTAQKNSSFSFDGSAETDGVFDLRGSRQGDQLVGGAMGDSLRGDDGGDTIQGNGGGDMLFGGLGPDRFIYLAVTDSGPGDPDIIGDLGQTDIIDLSAIDANTGLAGDQKFHLVSDFSHHAGELVLSLDHGDTRLSADVDGDGSADMLILLEGDQTGFTHFKL